MGRSNPSRCPPLDVSDALVRTLVQALSESPAVVAWLPTKGLVRNFTVVVVTNIADGATPAKHLRALRPPSSFSVVASAGALAQSERSYQRYAWIADAVTSIKPSAAATVYATLKPRMEEAHRELGSSAEPFDRTLARAIVTLLAAALDRAVPLRPQGIGYAYADDGLEALTAAQKQLLRMGPRNVRIIKSSLREIALALGIPASDRRWSSSTSRRASRT